MKPSHILTATLILSNFLAVQSISAHPVSYKGAAAVMIWNQPDISDYWLAYSFSPHVAVAARAMRMEMPEGQFITYFPQLDLLLKRWNNADSQANIYAYGGAGGAKYQGESGYAGQLGIEADAESRTWLIMGKVESTRSNVSAVFNHGEFRLGLAPYEAEFNELASWFMIQVQYHPAMTQDYAITPLYRFYYKSFLAEAGVSLRGEWMSNFMFHF